jgi:hypothetical protein
MQKTKTKDRYLRDEGNVFIWPMPSLVQKAEEHLLLCDGMRLHNYQFCNKCLECKCSFLDAVVSF